MSGAGGSENQTSIALRTMGQYPIDVTVNAAVLVAAADEIDRLWRVLAWLIEAEGVSWWQGAVRTWFDPGCDRAIIAPDEVIATLTEIDRDMAAAS